MMKKQREIMAIVDAPDISLSENDAAGDSLLKFYKALGWNSNNEFLDPSKVRTTKAVFDRLYDITYEKHPEPIAIGMLFVNQGPGVDDDIPEGKVYLLKGWVSSDETN